MTHRGFDGARHHYRAEAAECHRCRLRAARRRLWNVSIQAYLTAVAINLKRLARAVCGPLADGARRAARRFARRVLDLLAHDLRRLCPA